MVLVNICTWLDELRGSKRGQARERIDDIIRKLSTAVAKYEQEKAA
jgi:hypothetical protein